MQESFEGKDSKKEVEKEIVPVETDLTSFIHLENIADRHSSHYKEGDQLDLLHDTLPDAEWILSKKELDGIGGGTFLAVFKLNNMVYPMSGYFQGGEGGGLDSFGPKRWLQMHLKDLPGFTSQAELLAHLKSGAPHGGIYSVGALAYELERLAPGYQKEGI